MPYSKLYAFDYTDSELEFQFTQSHHNLIIFDCNIAKMLKYLNIFAVLECDNRHLDWILEI